MPPPAPPFALAPLEKENKLLDFIVLYDENQMLRQPPAKSVHESTPNQSQTWWWFGSRDPLALVKRPSATQGCYSARER
ncbi:hypothetical protein RRG08_026766 [Elysia crispata]|uniref:Uncharacterized protein n=1 Tax=Elysia crispata TaxID=231223 RepID=A0AAE1E3V0_9GAST|nr:hypothetical protein RRG08_026766 [Elysia crispata]